MAGRQAPNILVTGTPGTGKTTLAVELSQRSGLVHVDVSELVKTKGLFEAWDDALECYVINEDLVCDELEATMTSGGVVVDYHGCDFFPERWFDIVFVLRTDNTVLHDRLTARGYSAKKIEKNIECEIFQTLLDEAKDSYKTEVVHELQSNGEQDMAVNLQNIQQWISQWKGDN